MRTLRSLLAEQLETRLLMAADPTPAEQELLQLVNRLRTDPRGEFSRLFSSAAPLTARDAIFQNELNFFNVNGNVMRSEMLALNPVPPVTWNAAVAEFTSGHNAAMIGSNPPAQFHSNTTQRRQALLDAGVDLRMVQGELVNSENVYGFAKSINHTYASFVVDWGTDANGMQTDRPHRRALMNEHYDQLGHAVTPFGGSNFGPLVVSQVLVNIQQPAVMVVGAIFEDRNDSGWYEAGEGLRNVTIEFSGPSGTFTTRGLTAGGFQIELPQGTYSARASGGGMAHSVIVNNIVVGQENVWQNLIYDPTAIPPDSLEPNNSLSTVTATTGRDQTFNNLSIHTTSDVDLFSFVPAGTGDAVFRIQFTHAAGNLDLQLLNTAGNVVAASATTGNQETISFSVTRGTQYFVRVLSSGGATNGDYSLAINAPEPQRPIANNDRASASSLAPTTTINVLANDTDPDGDRSRLVPRLDSNAPAAFVLNSVNNRVEFTAPSGIPSSYVRTTYFVTDDQSMQSFAGRIDVMFVNFDDEAPWQNKQLRQDINGDNAVTPVDILAIINDISIHGYRELPSSGSVTGAQGLVDTNGDNRVSAIDILHVINYLNSADGNGESPSMLAALPDVDRDASLKDQALASLALQADDLERRRFLFDDRLPRLRASSR